jgi:hypothetical protein
MTTAPFDTLKLAESLQASGFTVDQARGAATALAEAITEGAASKDDIKDVRNDIAGLRKELSSEIGGLRKEFSGEIELAKRDLKIWFGSTLVVAVGILLAAIRYLPAPHP